MALVSWLSKASNIGRPFFHETFRLTLDLLNATHTRKYQIILEVSSYKESSHEKFKISAFPNLCPSYFNSV